MVKSAASSARIRKTINPAIVTGPEGIYLGDFTAMKAEDDPAYSSVMIAISIDSMHNDKIWGRSIVAGNERPFQGNYHIQGNKFSVTAKEPGSDKHDGTFSFILDPSKSSANGQWTSNDKTLKVTTRSFTLTRKPFRYNASLALPAGLEAMGIGEYDELSDKSEAITKDALRVNASTTLLKPADVENLYRGDLEVLRNSIYARHGYSFKNARMRNVFEGNVDWYMPVSNDVTGDLTETERKNIDLLKRYEQHAQKYYDSFGR